MWNSCSQHRWNSGFQLRHLSLFLKSFSSMLPAFGLGVTSCMTRTIASGAILNNRESTSSQPTSQLCFPMDFFLPIAAYCVGQRRELSYIAKTDGLASTNHSLGTMAFTNDFNPYSSTVLHNCSIVARRRRPDDSAPPSFFNWGFPNFLTSLMIVVFWCNTSIKKLFLFCFACHKTLVIPRILTSGIQLVLLLISIIILIIIIIII